MCLNSQPVGNMGGYSYLYIVDDNRPCLKVIEEFPVCCAMRGRYTENGKVEQKLEINSSNYINALTTVQKDCMILEVQK